MVIQRRGGDERFVRGGEHREAGPEARAQDTDPVIAPRGQPGDGASGVEYRLSVHL